MRNARFWAYVNGGPVKITLRPGQSLEHCEGGATDEGFHVEHVKWEYPDDEPIVYRIWCSDGRDCDGRLTHSGEDVCPVERLMKGNYPYVTDGELGDPMIRNTYDGVRWPDWQEHKDRGVYDEYAVAAGY